MPKPTYPAKLMVLDPIYDRTSYRSVLAALEATLVVEMTHDGRLTFDLRDTLKLGPRSYATSLIALGADLDAGYTLALAEPHAFPEQLEDLARKHGTAAQRDTVETAALSIVEHSHHQVRDVLDGDAHHLIGRSLVLARERTPKRRAKHYARDSFNSIGGVPTPRTEQLWNSLRSEWLDVRSAQHAQAAWQQWASHGRSSTLIRVDQR